MEIPAESPVDHPPLLGLERARLLELLGSLEPAQWHRPTPCPEWTVLGLATHLVGGDLSLVSWLRDEHRGTPAPDGVDEAGFIAWLDQLQAEWVEAARRLSPALTMELLAWLDQRVVDSLAALPPSALTASVSWASDRPVPVWLDQARELSERWIHRQQLMEAVGRPSDLRADLAAPVLDALRWAYPYQLASESRPAGQAVEITVSGPGLDRRWSLRSDGSGWRFAQPGEPPGSTVATLSLTAEQAWRLLSNNYALDRHGPITLDGDLTLLAVLTSTRAIIGAPG